MKKSSTLYVGSEIKPNIVSEQDAVEILTEIKIYYDKARL